MGERVTPILIFLGVAWSKWRDSYGIFRHPVSHCNKNKMFLWFVTRIQTNLIFHVTFRTLTECMIFHLNITWKHISKRWQHVCYSIYLSIFHVYFLLTCCSFFLSSLRRCYTTALLTGNPLVMHQVPLEVVHWNGEVGSGICNWNFYLLIWMLGLCSIDGREVVGAVQNVGIFVLAGRLLCTWHTVSM